MHLFQCEFEHFCATLTQGIRKEALGDERHEKIGDTLHNMGLVYKNQDNYEEAMTHYEGALVIRKDKLGEGHPKTADTLYNIGTLHTNNRDLLKALEYYEAAIRAYKKAGYPVSIYKCFLCTIDYLYMIFKLTRINM